MTATRIVNRLRSRLSGRHDAGFTLIETVIALSIAAFVFMALAAATMMALKGGLTARQNQMAVDMANQRLETIRALGFINVAHSDTDGTLSSDPRISSDTFDPGTGTAEPLIYLPSGVSSPLSPHITTEQRDATEYTLFTYVTAPAGYATDTRRVTIVVEWSVGGQVSTQQISTLVTDTRRGLPLPRFVFEPTSSTSITRGPSTQVVYGFKVHNYGARDSWNINGPTGMTWTYYRDLNGDGVKDATDVIALTDTTGDGTVDTGPVEVNADNYFLAVATAPGSTGTWNGEMQVVSAAQPAAASAAAAVPLTLTISTAPGPLPSPTPTGTASPSPTPSPTSTVTPGKSQDPWPLPTAQCGSGACSFPIYWLHEQPGGSHANNGSNSSTMDQNGSLQAAANDYSVGDPGAYGRYLNKGGSLLTETNRSLVADWRYQAPAKENYKAGKAVATLYIGCLVPTAELTVDVAVGTASSSSLGSFGSEGTGTAKLYDCNSTFQPLVVPVTISSNFSVTKNKYLVMRATLPASNTSAVRVAYDWASAPSSLVIPQ